MKRIAACVTLVAAEILLGGPSARAQEIEPRACPPPFDQTTRVTCATLTVPESRTRNSARRVRLAVAIVRASDPRPGAEPLLYLSGGPGLAALPDLPELLDPLFVADRDLILVDLRGTGASAPSLACPEADERVLLGAPSGDRAARAQYRASVEACRRRLRAAGIDLRAYDYTEMAADLSDLRRALGLAQWSVYGISNGGRLALELVRRHPDGIRSLVLDAALAPQGNIFLEAWANAQRAFDAFFARCAADVACSAAHPDLERRFWNLVARLTAEPVMVTVPDPVTGAPTTVVFDDTLALGALRGALYDTALIPVIPVLIDLLDAGTGFDLVASAIIADVGTPATFSLGQQLSDNCREEVAFIPRRAFARQARDFPRLASVILHDDRRELCRVWRVGRADPSVEQPVPSDLPALLLVGALDPVHPRSSSEAIARHLPNARLFEFPGVGHGTVMANACARTLMQAFLADPSAPLDAACVGG